MLQQVSIWVTTLFLISTAFTLWYFYRINAKPLKIILLLIGYAIVQSFIARNEFYLNTTAIPPRFLFVLLPLIFMIVIGMMPFGKRWFQKSRDIQRSAFIHTVRVPVEIVLHQLFLVGAIPELMTFEGRNFDIIIGITAPLVGFLYLKGMVGDKFLLGWNIVGLFFVLFIVVNAILSLPVPFQQFGFDQPNRAVFYFPYILLPVIIVPVVIYTHLSDIIILLKRNK